MKSAQLSYSLKMEQHSVWKYVHTQPFDGKAETNIDSYVCVMCIYIFSPGSLCEPGLSFFLLMREYDLISADMFFLQRPFISHPAPPLNTSLIVPIDCSAPAMRSHNRLTYGSMFDWLSIWQPILQPCYLLFHSVKNTTVSRSDLQCTGFHNVK